KKNNFVYFLLFFILSLLVREDIALVLLGFFVLSLVDKRKLKWKLTTLFLPIIYFVSALKIIDYFYQGGNYKFFIYYGWLGGDSLSTILWSWITHPIALLIHIFSLQNLGTAIIVLLPFLFLPLLRKKYLWLMLFPFLQLLMTASSLDFMVYSGHYILLFLPALFIALIFAIQKIKNKERFLGSDLIYKNKQAFFIISGFTVLYFLIFLSPVKSIVFADYNQERQNINQGFVSMIGEQDRIIAESTFVPQLSSRKDLHALSYSYFGVSQFAGFEFKAPEVEYILVDFSQAMSILTEKHQNQLLLEHKENMASNWREYLNDYNLIKASNNVLLWQNKKNNPNVENLDLFARQIKLDEFDSLDFLVENQYSDNHLKLTFQKTHAEEKEYLVRFYKEDYFYDVVLDYMMFPEKEWADNELISFYYYPDQQVESFQIFSWYGQNKFGKRKQLVVDIDVEPESDKINLSDIQ
ncbi:DUF2079 domain-containing protein, partial [Candidatus Parcubacteria bacterium]|nr:DUF2079 domain-containing protein [Candidatus Parcubacteria bacterium]